MVRRSSTRRLILVGGILAISCKCVVVTVHISSVPILHKFKKNPPFLCSENVWKKLLT
jgi:hypothetical protein